MYQSVKLSLYSSIPSIFAISFQQIRAEGKVVGLPNPLPGEFWAGNLSSRVRRMK